jgi:hypothetical protein
MAATSVRPTDAKYQPSASVSAAAPFEPEWQKPSKPFDRWTTAQLTGFIRSINVEFEPFAVVLRTNGINGGDLFVDDLDSIFDSLEPLLMPAYRDIIRSKLVEVGCTPRPRYVLLPAAVWLPDDRKIGIVWKKPAKKFIDWPASDVAGFIRSIGPQNSSYVAIADVCLFDGYDGGSFCSADLQDFDSSIRQRDSSLRSADIESVFRHIVKLARSDGSRMPALE